MTSAIDLISGCDALSDRKPIPIRRRLSGNLAMCRDFGDTWCSLRQKQPTLSSERQTNTVSPQCHREIASTAWLSLGNFPPGNFPFQAVPTVLNSKVTGGQASVWSQRVLKRPWWAEL
ncbi:unnamed protein product [Boreogadus saida]